MKQINTFRFLLFFCLVAAGNYSRAQLVDCNVFLKGNFVEVGVNWNGAYGSSVPAPAGYHGYVPDGGYLANALACGGALGMDTGRLGFVADPAMDGWTAGSPAYYGDYFVPGIPQEGWSVMADGMQSNNWNEDNGAAPDTGTSFINVYDSMSLYIYYDSVMGVYDTIATPAYSSHIVYTTLGSNTSYAMAGSQSAGVWEGMFDSIAIVQVTTLDTSALFFNVQVTMTNLASTPREHVHYMRTVDPDNEEPQTGSFTTKNVIEHQLPNPDNLTVVSAAGTVHPDAYLAMGTTDLRARAFICRMGLTPAYGTLDQIYAGDTLDYMYNQGDESTADVGIGLVFNIGHLASVDTVGAVDSAFRTTSATPPNRAVINFQYAFQLPTSTTGIKEVAKSNISVFPNPAKNNITVTNLLTTDHIRLYDMMGRVVSQGWSVSRDGANTFNITGMQPGMYILEVTDKAGTPKSKNPVQIQ